MTLNSEFNERSSRAMAAASRLWILFAVLAAAAAATVILLPGYREPPSPVLRGDYPAVLSPRPIFAAYFYPWLSDADRQLFAFGWLTLFLKLTAQLIFPVVIATAVAARRQSGVSRDDPALAAPMKQVWRRWCLISLALLLLVGIGNLIAIRYGLTPKFTGFQRQLHTGNHLATIAGSLVGIPLCGLLLATLSTMSGVMTGRPLAAVLVAYISILVLDPFVGIMSRETLAAIADMISPTAMTRWSPTAAALAWGLYAAQTGFVSVIAWYFTAPAPKRQAVAKG